MSKIDKRPTIRTLSGTVVSDSMDKTVIVAVTSVKSHPLYKKRYKVTKRYKAHDEDNVCRLGDLVDIQESRPLSKTKCWKIINKQ